MIELRIVRNRRRSARRFRKHKAEVAHLLRHTVRPRAQAHMASPRTPRSPRPPSTTAGAAAPDRPLFIPPSKKLPPPPFLTFPLPPKPPTPRSRPSSVQPGSPRSARLLERPTTTSGPPALVDILVEYGRRPTSPRVIDDIVNHPEEEELEPEPEPEPPPPMDPRTAAVTAALAGDRYTVASWLEGGGDVNASAFGMTLLPAASRGQQGIVELLLSTGATVDLPAADDAARRTALMHACIGRHPRIVRQLLQKGASLSTQSASGLTALGFASRGVTPGGTRLA